MAQQGVQASSIRFMAKKHTTVGTTSPPPWHPSTCLTALTWKMARARCLASSDGRTSSSSMPCAAYTHGLRVGATPPNSQESDTRQRGDSDMPTPFLSELFYFS